VSFGGFAAAQANPHHKRHTVRAARATVPTTCANADATIAQTPRDALAAWMASPEHCTNVLNPDYRQMGTGETASPVASVATDGGTWTQDFGLAANQSPLSHNTAPQIGCPYTIPSSPQG
jgi:hypothetical protein